MIAKNKMLVAEMRLLNENIATVKTLQQEVMVVRSSMDSYIWNFQNVRDSLESIKNEIGNIRYIKNDIDMIRSQLSGQVSNLQATNNMSMMNSRNLELALVKLTEKIEDVNKIVNDPTIVRGLDELRDLVDSVDSI